MLRKRLPQKMLAVTAAAALLVTAGTALAATECWDMEGATAGTVFHFTDTVITDWFFVEMMPYKRADGTWNKNGTAEVSASNVALGSPTQELEFHELNAHITPFDPATHGEFVFADMGGNINFSVNGDFHNVADFSDLDGTVVGDCTIDVIPAGLLGNKGTVTITPIDNTVTIDELSIGGANLFIDDFCLDF